MSQNAAQFGKPPPTKKRLKDLLMQKDNLVCADCRTPDPKWASVNIGVFLCLKCCGVHRSLGTHISKVLSVTLDEWSKEQVDSMVEVGGNAAANSIYEAYIPEGVRKPGANASHEERAQFIRSKYELQDFLKPGLRISSTKKSSSSSKKMTSVQTSFSKRIVDTILGSSSSSLSSSSTNKMEGMVEFIGLLKVKVIKGTNLAIRDMLSSDPYVVLTLGHQAQTTIIQSNLNPVWNEELMLSVPQGFGTVKMR